MDVTFAPIKELSIGAENGLRVLDMNLLNSGDVNPGILSEITGKASYDYLLYTIQAALNKEIDGFVTLPVNKEAVPGVVKFPPA